MSRFRNQHNWNEFRWENEIRRDERRINRYFTELASCLDLPGEEEIIAGLISETPGLVPTAAGNHPDALRGWSYLAPHDDEQEFEDDYSTRRPEQALVNLLDHMACQWNRLWITTFPLEFSAAGLGISCAYGKLMARFADFADADSQTEKGLKISLGKRTLADINELADALKFISENNDFSAEVTHSHLENLANIRDRVISILNLAKQDKA